MKRIIKLTESDLARIVRRVINEQDEKDVYSDLYGKTVTFKSIEMSGVVIKGIIKGVSTQGDGIDIKLKESITDGDTDGLSFDENNNDYFGNLNYDCSTKTFYIKLEGKRKDYKFSKFTCKGLSDVLSQRYPCATDFSMNSDFDVPNNLA
jgi:hypothetical protein